MARRKRASRFQLVNHVELGVASASRSNINPRSSTLGVPSKAKADKNVGHRKQARKQRFTGVLLKSPYQKAVYILSNIAKNMKAGNVDLGWKKQ